MIRTFSQAVQDSRGNFWAERTNEDGELDRFAVRQTVDAETGDTVFARYTPEDREAIARGGLQEALLGPDAFRWQSGSRVESAEFDAFLSRLLDTRYTVGVEGLNAESYLTDARAMIRSEGGALIYRPELAQGDFQAKETRPRGFMHTLAGFLSAPPIRILSLPFAFNGAQNALAGTGSAAASAGDEFLNAMAEFVPGGKGVAEAIAATTISAAPTAVQLTSALPKAGQVASAAATPSVLEVVKQAGQVAGSVGAIATGANLINQATSDKPSAPPLTMPGSAGIPMILTFGGSDMANAPKSAPTATPLGGGMDSILILAVIAVAVMAFMGEAGE